MVLKNAVKYLVCKVPGAQTLWVGKLKPGLQGVKHDCKRTVWKRHLKNINNLCITPENQKRDVKIIVSLTSYPKRINEVPYVVCSLFRQTMKPDEVLLNLSIEEFPNREGDLKNDLLRLRQYGLTVNWCHNIGPYKKLIPTLKKFPNDIVITVDDDVYYPPNLVETLYNGYLDNDNSVICLRARRIAHDCCQILPYTKWKVLENSPDPSADILQTGVGGVLYPPDSLFKDVMKEEIFMGFCPMADDIWFWAMAVLANLKTKAISMMNKLDYIDPKEQESSNTLFYENVINGQNDVAFAAILRAYPTLKQIVLNTPENLAENGGILED